MDSGLEKLRQELLAFREARDWEQFHTPRNLATSVAVEAAELLEHFQWHRDGETPGDHGRAEVAREMADVLACVVLLADDLGVDLVAEALAKVEENAERFPAREAKGRAWSNKRGRGSAT